MVTLVVPVLPVPGNPTSFLFIRSLKHLTAKHVFLLPAVIVEAVEGSCLSHVERLCSSGPSAAGLHVCDAPAGQSDLPHAARCVGPGRRPFLGSTCRLLHVSSGPQCVQAAG